MTLNYGIFDVSDPQNPDRVYSAALLSRILSKHIRDGIVHGGGGELAVTVTDPPAMSVQVGTGTAMVQGRFCENDAALTLSVPAADTTYARIDRVVVRLNASPGRVIDILVKKGTPAPSPVPPGLTRTAETWELSLAQVRVEAGATSIVAGKITDERGNTSLCGVAAPAYVPSSQVEVVGAMNMQGHALTGLPVPSGATDAARKGYVDSEIAGKIGGFGISQIAIDADKNWNGKNITNVGVIRTSDVTCVGNTNILFLSTPSDTVQASSTNVLEGNISNWQTAAKFLMPSNVLRGGIRIRAQVKQTYVSASYSLPLTRILVDGVNVGELDRSGGTGWKGASKDIYDNGMWGSIVEIQFMSDQGQSNKECGIRNCSICATFSRLPTSETPVTQTLV